ncbi:MAG: hypothetical protein AAF441_20325 [Pseudomonadota bacterium]
MSEENPDQTTSPLAGGEGSEPGAQTKIPPPADKKSGAQDEPPKHVRPEGLEDPFWSDDNGVNFEALLGEFGQLKEFKAEADIKASGLPESADAYKLEIPEDLDLPEGAEVKIAEDDPLLLAARGWAHEAGLSQEAFSGLTDVYVRAKAAEAKHLHESLAEQRALLGENVRARVDAVTTALSSRIGKELAAEINPMLVTANQVKAFEALLRSTKSPSPPPRTEQEDAGIEGWGTMSPDEKLAAAHKRARNNGQVGPHAQGNPTRG